MGVVVRARAHRGAADRPAALHRRARPSARAATDRAVDLLPLLVHPAGAVLRVGNGRHRDPLRQAPLRDHRRSRRSRTRCSSSRRLLLFRVIAGRTPGSRPHARREVDPRGRRSARRRGLRRRARGRAHPFRIQVPSTVRATRRTAPADAAPLRVGGAAARGDRAPPPDLDRGGQSRGGRCRRVPVRVRCVHGRVLDPRAAGAHDDPSRDVPRREPRRRCRVRRSHPLGTRPDGDTRVAGVGCVPRALVAGDEGHRARVEQPRAARRRARVARRRLVLLQRLPPVGARFLRAATAARRRWLRSGPRSSARWS